MTEDARDKIIPAIMGQEDAKLWILYLDMFGVSDDEIIKGLNLDE